MKPDARQGPQEDGRSPERMAGLAKGLAIVEAFGAGHRRLTVADAARATDLSRAAARRCLLTLFELGFVSFDGSAYVPTPRMSRLGISYLDEAPLPILARPHLEAARDEIGESVGLHVYDSGSCVCVARADATHLVSTGIGVGARLPAYGSATGRILLASLPEDELDEFLRTTELHPPRTPKSIVDRAELRRLIDAARDDGVAVADEEIEMGLRALSVPVSEPSGQTVAALTVSATTSRATIAQIYDFLPAMREHAGRLGRCL